jgi:uncharacterized protein (TIGR02246 family)
MVSVSVPPTARATDSETIRLLLSEFFDAVEQHDAERFLASFAAGEGVTVFENKEMYDWPQFVEFVEGFFKEIAEIAFDLEKCNVDTVTPGVAVATGSFRGAGKTVSGEPVEFRNSFTFVLLRLGERWLIKHAHESTL